MKAEDVYAELQQKGVVLELLNDQLIAACDSLSKVPRNIITLLTSQRTEIKVLLQARERELEAKSPSIDEDYCRGRGKIGCLVIPSGCALRYRYWLPSFSYIPIESDDWHERYQKIPTEERLKLQWRPLTLREILEELNASAELIGLYCKKKHKKDQEVLHGSTTHN